MLTDMWSTHVLRGTTNCPRGEGKGLCTHLERYPRRAQNEQREQEEMDEGEGEGG